jgi:hypothetical protein
MRAPCGSILSVLLVLAALNGCGGKLSPGAAGNSPAESPPPDGSTGSGGGGQLPPQRDSHPHSVTVTWDASPSVITGYRIYRGATDGGPYSVIGQVDAATRIYVDKDVTAGKTYYFVATAFNSDAESVFSNQAVATIPTP